VAGQPCGDRLVRTCDGEQRHSLQTRAPIMGAGVLRTVLAWVKPRSRLAGATLLTTPVAVRHHFGHVTGRVDLVSTREEPEKAFTEK
jgi:hypothetical protein